MRTMWAEDLGDPRLYEDEAIREQAARLQVHLGNLTMRIRRNGVMSAKTQHRVFVMKSIAGKASKAAYEIYAMQKL